MSVEVFPVESRVAPELALRLAPDIERALEHGGDFTLDDIHEKLAARDWQLWAVTREGKHAGCVITHVAVRPAAKVVEIVLLAGKDARKWMPETEDVIEAWARDLGAVAMEATGRDGWERRMKPAGWCKSAVVIRRELH